MAFQILRGRSNLRREKQALKLHTLDLVTNTVIPSSYDQYEYIITRNRYLPSQLLHNSLYTQYFL